MPRPRTNLPAVLAVPLLADRLAVELATFADEVQTLDESPVGRERAAFLASASAQVRAYGTAALVTESEPEPESAGSFTPRVLGDDLETRGA